MIGRRVIIAAVLAIASSQATVFAWGERGHVLINRLAVQSLPSDGPMFLQAQEEWIAQTGPLPDRWRLPSEPFVRTVEDPNHHWWREAFSFLKEIPRSRYEFVLALNEEYRRHQGAYPHPNLAPTVFAGTLPYEAVEVYERLQATMRLYRRQLAKDPTLKDYPDPQYTERDIAFLTGWLGHYIGDGSQPLHGTVNGVGWILPNPNGYTTTPAIHARFETAYLNLIAVTPADVRPLLTPAARVADPFSAILLHIDRAASHAERVYQLDKQGAFADANNAEARQLVMTQLAAASSMLRDLIYTAWINSGMAVGDTGPEPFDPKNPAYNPATGSAPAPRPK